jgi:FtsP/CotA-like multicopper oxidase with cupredoxin domain
VREGLIDTGWHDTVLILPGDTVRLQMRFTAHPGLYLYHCHILEHEDMGMMRNFRVRG